MPAVHRAPGRGSSMERLPPAFPNPGQAGASGDGRSHLGECRRASPSSRTVPRPACRGGHPDGDLLHGRARLRDRRPGYPGVRPPLRGEHRIGGRRGQCVRPAARAGGAARRPAGGPLRRAPGDGGRYRHRRGQQHPGRLLRVVRAAHRAARDRRPGLGNVQCQRPDPVAGQRAARSAGPGQWPVLGRVPRGRHQRPGDRRAARGLVAAGPVLHLRRHAHRPGGHRRGGPARPARAGFPRPGPGRPAVGRDRPRAAEPGLPRRGGREPGGRFRRRGGTERHRAAVRPRLPAPGRRCGRASGSSWSPC